MELIYFSYNHNILPPELPTRKIPFYDLTFVLKGTLSYWVEERKYTLKENEAIFLPINCERVREKSDRRASYVSFNFLSDEPYELPVFLPEVIDRETNLLLACTEEIKRR